MRSLIIAAIGSIAALSFVSNASAASVDWFNQTHPQQAGAGGGKLGVVHPHAVVHCKGKTCHKPG